MKLDITNYKELEFHDDQLQFSFDEKGKITIRPSLPDLKELQRTTPILKNIDSTQSQTGEKIIHIVDENIFDKLINHVWTNPNSINKDDRFILFKLIDEIKTFESYDNGYIRYSKGNEIGSSFYITIVSFTKGRRIEMFLKGISYEMIRRQDGEIYYTRTITLCPIQ